MKLRQKLAMVMAAAMIVTAVPVTTMAASTNSLNKTIAIVADQPITTNQGLKLTVDYTTDINSEDVFYLTAKDFEFNEDYYKDGVNIEVNDAVIATVKGTKSELTVTVNPNNGTATIGKVDIPVVGTPKKGTPSITIDAVGSFATGGTVTLSGEVTSDKALVVTNGDAKTIAVDAATAEIADIVIEEKVAGGLAGQTITVKLPNNSDLNFAASQTVVLEGKRGLTATTGVTVTRTADEKVLEIKIPAALKTDRPGSLTVKGIDVVPEDKKADLKKADVTVTVKGDKLDETKLTVAKVAEYDVALKVAEVKTLTAGHGDATVKVILEETTPGSLGSKPVYLTTEGAKVKSINALNDAADVVATTKDGYVTEVTVTPKKGKYEIEFTLEAKASATGAVTVVAEGRGLEKELTTEVAKVEAPFTIEKEAFELKTGVRKQKGGKVVITEAKAGKFGKNQKFVIASEDSWIDIDAAKVEVTAGDAKIETEVVDGEIIVTVTRTSDEASEITVSDIEVTTSKAIADGKYDLYVGGTAVASTTNETKDFEDKLVVGEFFVTEQAKSVAIGEGPEVYLNEDNRMMAKLRVVAEAFDVDPSFAHVDGVGVITFFKDGKVVQFTNGSNIMNLNGVAITMDTKTVIKEDGYTYVPARFLAEGLGLTVNWDADARVATFTAK